MAVQNEPPSTNMSKTSDVLDDHVRPSMAQTKTKRVFEALINIAIFLVASAIVLSLNMSPSFYSFKESGPICAQQADLYPHTNISSRLEVLYGSTEFIPRAVDWLAGAVRVPYVSTHAYVKLSTNMIQVGELRRRRPCGFGPSVGSFWRASRLSTLRIPQNVHLPTLVIDLQWD